MRVLHSSDWHLGQHFMGKSREPEHRAFLRWLIDQVRELGVDALIVAGDIFDTGTPPSYARRLYNHFIVELRETGCQLVVLGGNHDSVSTLHESRELLACLDTRVIGGVTEDPGDQVITLHRQDGTPGAVLCAIPYLRPRDLLESHAGESREYKRDALASAIREHYTVIYELARAQREALLASQAAESGAEQALPIIATGHLTTVGGQISESVRELYIGTLEAFPAAAFPPADYIALGHLHRAQKVAGTEHIRYSGSPIALSFDESTRGKQVLLVDFAGGALDSVKEIEVPVWQPLLSLRGSLEELADQLVAHFEGEPERETTTWLEVEVETDDYLSDLQLRVQELLADLPVEILRIRRKRAGAAASLQTQARETLQELSVDEVFRRRLALEELDDVTRARLSVAFENLRAELDESDVGEAP
ncbi:nuclease SbcCD subunit D [Marinobacterium nitratireducens]|uniref:Nuclease SbcCD subunit D n=1 Tax=Marinobacterium nitratireducens TaxID=518897 RepID=A0A918DNL2_9GAMM|nr:exonuclease subunit SbcD [Marinobacterium nitratireducens]GGO75666.1 nuclease SbcCD subunit D [Marinobacterium nitratireducens]